MSLILRSSLVCLLALATAAAAQEEGTYLDPDKAGIDYQMQGEYVGELGPPGETQRWGLQVIALGDGKFQVFGLEGGLPGDGWTRGDERRELSGTLEGDSVRATDGEVTLMIRDGEVTVSHQSQPVGTMNKVHRESETLGAEPPEGAVVLFDGSSADAFVRGTIVEDNLLASDCESKQTFGDHTLHLEFRTPFKPNARGQARGNSGLYLQSRYEVQVLDSFGLTGENNECGGIYSIAQPDVNMCFPPLTWQTYDVEFRAARYDGDGNKIENARATVRHNGVVIHDNIELPHGTPGKLQEGPEPAGIYLQGHGNPVRYRNVWVVPH